MCLLEDAACVAVEDVDGDYQRAVYLICCKCSASYAPINPVEPFCNRCLQKLHRIALPDDMTKCGRCSLVMRGVMPQPMCYACQSITNYNGYNDKLIARIHAR